MTVPCEDAATAPPVFPVALDAATAAFYARVAQAAALPIEQVLSDALFKLAAELSLEALDRADRR